MNSDLRTVNSYFHTGNSDVRTVNSVVCPVNSDFGFSGFFGSVHGYMCDWIVILGFVCWVFAIINMYLLYVWCVTILGFTPTRENKGLKVLGFQHKENLGLNLGFE